MKISFCRWVLFFAVLLLSLPGVFAQQDGEAAAGEASPPAKELAADSPAASTAMDADGLAEMTEGVEEIIDNIERTSGTLGFNHLWQRFVAALVIIVVQILVIWLLWHFFFIWLGKKVIEWGRQRLKPLTIKKLKLLTVAQMLNVIVFSLKILKYLITVFQLFLTLPVIFSLFPQTQNIADRLFGYILTPLKRIVFGVVGYVPNLFTIAIILWVMRYAQRGLKFFATQIERGRLVINGFYPDWAQPTFNILRVLVYAFTVVIIYPYLPGSGSAIFQGVSVFVGIIFSLGSSSAIGNIVAGLVITYMRPFKIGDRIQIGTVTGFVAEKTLIVIKLRTHKNEYVTFPNTMILSSSITNYSTSGDDENNGVVLHADVTMNYQVPWRTVEEVMINAALKTTGLESEPRPWVLQTGLEDFYARYEINAHAKNADNTPAIYADLYRNLQDCFAAEGIDLTAPIYRINLPTSSHTPPVKKIAPGEGGAPPDALPAGAEAEKREDV
jgi:small-conductance mechanosensitive channel